MVQSVFELHQEKCLKISLDNITFCVIPLLVEKMIKQHADNQLQQFPASVSSPC